MQITTDTIRINDTTIGYVRSGDPDSGVPWVFVHGLGEDSTSWTPQLNALATTRPAYAVDVRGHGRTELGAADGTLQQLANDLLDFLETIGPSVCIGFSMGGAIVLAAAASDRKHLVERAVCVCTSSVVGRRIADRFRTRADGIDRDGADFARVALIDNLTVNVLTKSSEWDEEVATRLAAIGDGAGYANGARAMASMNEHPLTPKLSNVDCQVDVFVGEHDASCPWRAGEIIVGAVTNGRAHLLPGVGHFVNIERPEVLTEALLDL